MKKYWLLGMIFWSTTAIAQKNNESFFSRIYFPFDVGGAVYPSNILAYGGLAKTSLEYRFEHQNSFFIRFNYDNRKAEYHLPITAEFTNLQNSDVHFSDLVLGLGYRKGSKRWQWVSLVQAGPTAYSVPSIQPSGDSFRKTSRSESVWISKITTGIEYYLYERVALTLEVTHLYHWQQQDFFADQPSAFAWSIGFTTPLF